jgi:hypothetical protein
MLDQTNEGRSGRPITRVRSDAALVDAGLTRAQIPFLPLAGLNTGIWGARGSGRTPTSSNAVHLGGDRVDERTRLAAAQAADKLREHIVLDEVVEVEDAQHLVPLAGVFKLVPHERRERRMVLRRARDGDAM